MLKGLETPESSVPLAMDLSRIVLGGSLGATTSAKSLVRTSSRDIPSGIALAHTSGRPCDAASVRAGFQPAGPPPPLAASSLGSP